MTTSTETPNLHLLYGDDEYRVSEKAWSLVNKWCPPEEQTLGLEMIDARALTESDAVAFLMDALEAVQTTSLLGGRKVVWLRDVNFWTPNFTFRGQGNEEDATAGTKSRTHRSRLSFKEAETAFYQALKAGWPAEHVLVISVPNLDGRLALLKHCKAAGQCWLFKQPTEKPTATTGSLTESTLALWQELGLQPARRDVLQDFIERVGPNTRALRQESLKLDAYLGNAQRQVTKADVLQVVCGSPEAMVWDLSEQIGRRRSDTAIRILRQLFFQGEAAIKLVVILENHLRDLIVLRDCMRMGWLVLKPGRSYREPVWSETPEVDEFLGQLSRDPRGNKSYRTYKLAEQAEQYTLLELMRAHQDLVALHERLVSGDAIPDLLLETWILKTATRQTR